MADTALQSTAGCAAPGCSAAPARTAGGPVFAPRVDIVETDDALLLYADLPGVRPDDVSLTARDGQLVLTARCPARTYGTTAVRAEYGVGDYRRAFTVSERVDADRIEASLADGVLTVRLPKADVARTRRIAVTAG